MPLSLQLVDGEFTICRLRPSEPVPTWAASAVFSSVTRTNDELSIICPAPQVPVGVRCEAGWKLLKLVGPFDFGAVGILVSVAEPLARAGVSLLAVGTFDTDDVLIKAERLAEAGRILQAAGHSLVEQEG